MHGPAACHLLLIVRVLEQLRTAFELVRRLLEVPLGVQALTDGELVYCSGFDRGI